MKKDSIKTYLICNESGCKGFADKPCNNTNDIGVFAGSFNLINVPTSYKNLFFKSWKYHFKNISDKWGILVFL